MRSSSRACTGRRVDSDEGVSLVELLVAVAVLAIGVTGLLQGVVAGLGLARSNEARALAANVADERMSILRSTDFGAIPLGQTEETVTRGGTDFEVSQDAVYVSIDSSDSPCDSPGGAPSYLRVSVRVSWTGMGAARPVEADTLITPPVADYDPYKGHLSVKVTGRDTMSQSGIVVRVTHTSGSPTSTQLTTSSGCAFFPNLDPGDYDVVLQQPGHVSRASVVAPVEPVTIGVAETRGVAFNYDEQAHLTLTGPTGTMPVAVTSAALPDGQIPVSVFNSNHDTSPWEFASATALAAQPLYPHASGWDVRAGCDPSAPGDDVVHVAADPGQTATLPLPVALVRVAVADLADEPVAGARLRLVGQCSMAGGPAEEVLLDFDADADADGQQAIAVPAGTWEVQVLDAAASGTWPTVDVVSTSDEDVSVQVAG